MRQSEVEAFREMIAKWRKPMTYTGCGDGAHEGGYDMGQDACADQVEEFIEKATIEPDDLVERVLFDLLSEVDAFAETMNTMRDNVRKSGRSHLDEEVSGVHRFANHLRRYIADGSTGFGQKTPWQQYLDGEISDFDDLVSAWHDGTVAPEDLTLSRYLGMTESQYSVFMMTPQLLRDLRIRVRSNMEKAAAAALRWRMPIRLVKASEGDDRGDVWATNLSPACLSRGPRVGDATPVCGRVYGHDGAHSPHPAAGWGDVTWSDGKVNVSVPAQEFGGKSSG